MINWNDYPNFTKEEFDCKETGENDMHPELLVRVQALRTRYGKPIRISSGYRSKRHSKEAKKPQPGMHTKGLACDIACHSDDAYELVEFAFELGFTGIGISQVEGKPRFIHLDLRDTAPRIYSY
jgi:uncharacterized protein YcbK (DUF882 family)